ncbi:hypothetical protein [uncultured Ruminococcus sp.]|uniref:hypothetical protein n=1 Tax=uncultured Ruminococcus sp. TaxID=165186 RepID=UPI0026319BAF|nr:hypothetical protein [uncultured Ruminococcus sp.]
MEKTNNNPFGRIRMAYSRLYPVSDFCAGERIPSEALAVTASTMHDAVPSAVPTAGYYGIFHVDSASRSSQPGKIPS